MLLSKHHRHTTMPEQSSVCWHPRHRATAGLVNNPLHFRGELSTLRGREWGNIREKRPEVRAAPGWLGRCPVLLGTRRRGRPPARCARERRCGRQTAESGVGPASSGRAAGRPAAEAGGRTFHWGPCGGRCCAVLAPARSSQSLENRWNRGPKHLKSWKVSLEALEGGQ